MKLRQVKSKFYKEFMKSMIKDILSAIFGIMFLIAIIRLLFLI